MYIIFEGADGCGKTTLAIKTAEFLKARFVHEPDQEISSCSILKDLAFDKNLKNNTAKELMMLASRCISLESLNNWRSQNPNVPIVSDRGFLSGFAYSFLSGGIETSLWWEIFSSFGFKKGLIPNAVVYVTSDTHKAIGRPDKAMDDEYDNMSDIDREYLSIGFNDILSTLEERGDIKIVRFNNRFDLTVQENFDKLIKEII